MNIYVSTSALKNPHDLERVLAIYQQHDIQLVELGSSHKYSPNLNQELERFSRDMKFVVHNYFPPHEEPFALNLSSLDDTIRKKSVDHAKHAIDLCTKINSPIYSIHAGMLRNPKKIEFFKGFSFDEQGEDPADYALAYETLIQSCLEINHYAKENGIKFAIENSGGHPKKYQNLMITKTEDLLQLVSDINDINFGILLDIGHLKVTKHVYGHEDAVKTIQLLGPKIFQVHIHSNNGQNDQHLPPTKDDLKILNHLHSTTVITLESMNNNMEDILTSVELMTKFEV